MSAPTGDDLIRIKRAREAELLLKFGSGRPLSPAEMAELQHLLPAAVLSRPPEPQPEYLHPYAHYAKLVGCGERHIKRYIHIGRRAKPFADFPPFDRPAEFLSWFRRHITREPGPNILAFVGSGKKESPTTAPPAAAVPVPPSAPVAGSPPSDPEKPAAMRFEYAGVGGFEESVRELRVTVASAQNRLRRAMDATPMDESLVTSCNLAVAKQLDLLRKSENDLFDFQQKRGELVPRAEIREDWRTILSALRQMRRSMEDNVAADLSKSGLFTPEQLALVRASVGNERGREDQLLRSSKYWVKAPDVSPSSSPAV